MEIGIDSFAILPQGAQPANQHQAAAERMEQLLAEIETADRAGLDVFGLGEHHRPEFLDSAPALILAAAAARTTSIRLTSAVTVLGAADPVRVFQQFATLDLISKGRAEIVVGRGSSVEAFPLFGYDLNDYDDLFVEKLDLLLKSSRRDNIAWSGRFRPALRGQGIYPRPLQEQAADLARRWRYAAVICSRGHARSAADAGGDRRTLRTVSPAGRSLSRSGLTRGTPTGNTTCGIAHDRLRRSHINGSRGHFLSRLGAINVQGRPASAGGPRRHEQTLR